MARDERNRVRAAETDRQERLAEARALDALKSELGRLRALARSLDETLNELQRVYRYGCVEAEQTYQSIARKYWRAQNRQAARQARAIERDWLRDRRRAIRRKHQVPPKPSSATWIRSAAQARPLSFERPPELA
jgi:hypothetical protein